MTGIAEEIEDRREAFFADPGDIETIHRFRTRIRALRSLVTFIKPWQNATQNAETQAILKEIVGYTSLLRELDVLEKHVRAKEDFSPKFVDFCKKEASEERAKVLETLASKHVSKSFERAMASAKNVTWKKRLVRQGLPQGAVRARFDPMVETIGSELAHVDLRDAEQTHDVRKRAKRTRYVAEYCSGILGPDVVDIAAAMTAHQDTLGDVCDARANIRLVDEFLQRDLPKAVIRDLTTMRKQNEVFLRNVLETESRG